MQDRSGEAYGTYRREARETKANTNKQHRSQEEIGPDVKLQDYRDTRDYFSATASDIARKLAFAGIAIVWVFKNGSEGQDASFPGELLPCLGLFAGGLMLDLLHYIYGTIAWAVFSRVKECGDIGEDEDV